MTNTFEREAFWRIAKCWLTRAWWNEPMRELPPCVAGAPRPRGKR